VERRGKQDLYQEEKAVKQKLVGICIPDLLPS